MDQQKIEQFIQDARSQGASDAEIQAYLSQKTGQQASPTVQTQPMGVQDGAQPAPQQEQGDGLIRSIAKSLISPFERYGKFVGEAAFQGGRFLTDEAWRKATLGQDLTEEESKHVMDSPTTRFVDPKILESKKSIATEGLKSTAGVASMLVPFGKGAGIASKVLLPGAAVGGLQAASEKDADIVDVAEGALGGAATAGVFAGGAAALKGITKKLVSSVIGGTTQKAAQFLNRATPSQFSKAVETLGLDLNKLTQKYAKGSKGYGSLLGTIKERGRGGTLGKTLNKAETQIQNTLKISGRGKSAMKVPVDEFVVEMSKEAKLLKSIPGNEANVSALKKFITETKRLYKNGITPQKLLDIKRSADSKFGAAVVDEQTGSVAAQGQKMLANAARKKLKQLFPEIKDALNTQSEILTLRPVLNRARGTSQTLGSTIRKDGGITGIDISKPFGIPGQIRDIAVGGERRAGAALGVLPEAGEAVSKAMNAIPTSTVARIGTVASGLGNQEDIETIPTEAKDAVSLDQALNEQVEPQQSAQISDDGMWQWSGSQWTPTPEHFKQLKLQDFAQTGGKNLDKIQKLEEAILPQEESQLELSDGAITNITQLKSALSNLGNIETSIGQSDLVGPIQGLARFNPYAEKSVSLQAEIDVVRQTVGKALEGGVLRKEDEEKYKKILPTMGDTKKVALQKIIVLRSMLIRDLQDYVTMQSQYGKGRTAENLVGGALDQQIAAQSSGL